MWRIVADPRPALSEWVPTGRLAQPVGADEARLERESRGDRCAVTSPFHADKVQRRLGWGAPHVPGYQGSLRVAVRW